MASGRPRRPNDPSVMASVETALSSVARPGIFGLIWNWRYELGLSAGLATVGLASGYALGAAWLIAIATAGLVLLAARLAWPPGDDTGWPFLNRGETDRADPEEPARSGGLGNHGPFG
jgi:hypothetical protein